MVVVAGTVFGDGLFEHLAGFVVLAAVEEDLYERVSGVRIQIEDRAEQGDEMVFGGQLESPDAIGGFREAFVFGERVHFEDALGAVRVLFAPPTVGRERFHAELRAGETSAIEDDLSSVGRCQAGVFRQRETPAFAVVLRRFP